MSSLKAILLSRQLTDVEADAIVAGLKHDDIGIEEPMSVYDYGDGKLRNVDKFSDNCAELRELVNAKAGNCVRTAKQKIAFTALVTHSVAAGAAQVREINEALGLSKGAGTKETDGQIVIGSAEVDVMREAEKDAAGGLSLPAELMPSARMVIYHMRGLKAQTPFLREFDLSRSCTMTAAQAVRSYAPSGDVEKLAGEREFDNYVSEGRGVIPSLQRILLDRAARSIASATSVAAGDREVSGEHGQVLHVKGKRVRINGGRQMLLDMLSTVLEHGAGKTGEQLEHCYMASVKDAAKAYDPSTMSVTSAHRHGVAANREMWRSAPPPEPLGQRAGGKDRAGTGTPSGPRPICEAHNTLAGCPNRVPCPGGRHVCSYSQSGGGLCQDTGHGKCGHKAAIEARKRRREKEDESRGAGTARGGSTNGSPGGGSSSSSSTGTSRPEKGADKARDDRMRDFLAQLGKT
jgi:hypothetical protein